MQTYASPSDLSEPHFFAGFSGGPKAVAPGVAGIETIFRLHRAELIADPNSTWAYFMKIHYTGRFANASPYIRRIFCST